MLVLGLVLVAVVAGFTVVGAKNGAIERDETVQQAWGNVEAQYQRRFDLIPNLVQTVKGAADFEQETLTAVTQARASVGQVKVDAGKLAGQQGLGSALSRLLVVTERYPELRATRNFADLQHQLEGTENRIAVARTDYNRAVQDYNAFTRKIPNAWFLSQEEFPRRTPFEATKAAGEAPKVDFGKGN
ncbi:MAG: LemA family protein [Planctomycetota bacterium]